jgi:hypothetical protein
VAPRFVQYSTASSPGTGGVAGTEPVASTNRSNWSSRPPTSIRPGAVTRASPRTSSIRSDASHFTWPSSVQSLVIQSRQPQISSTSTGPRSACAAPGARFAAARTSTARSIVFVGMHAQ